MFKFSPVALALLALAGCGELETNAERETTAREEKVEKTALRRACGSQATYNRLKELVFDEAVRVRKAGSPLLDQLAASSVVRMEEPVVKSRDEELDVTVCSGRMLLELPPGVTDAFDGEQRLAADIEYAAQAAVDGSGLVFQIEGAEPIIYRLAAVTLGERRAPAPRVAAAPIEPPVATELPPPPPPPPSPAPAATPRPRPPAATAPSPARVAVARPSFNCRYARTSSERAICGDARLAAKDRAMAARYYDAMNGLGGEGRRALRASRDRFLAYRDRCRDNWCIARAYDDRVDEIEDIASDFRR